MLLDDKDYDVMMQPGTEVSEENLEHELGIYYLDRHNTKRSSWNGSGKPQRLRRNYTHMPVRSLLVEN